MAAGSKIIPELDVANLERSRHFYTNVFPFQILYERSEERFLFLDLDGAQLMLQEADGPGRRFRTAPLEHPFGRGINLQIEVPDVVSLYEAAVEAQLTVVIPLEMKWYRKGLREEVGNRQFVCADPDGYLLRFYSDLGARYRTDLSI